MIRQAEAEDFQGFRPDSEAAARILGLVRAYGIGRPFIRCWRVEKEEQCAGLLSLLDGAAVLAVKRIGAVTEEVAAFLMMQTDIQSLRTSAEAARVLGALTGWDRKTGCVMRPGESLQTPLSKPESLSPREIYPILTDCFGSGMPPFSPWYVDVSHRVRHGCCRIVGFREDGNPAACAMTTAECDGAAIIGAVATMPAGRGKGYASANVLTLTNELVGEGRQVYLSPKNEAAHELYARIGFADCGEWGTLKRKKATAGGVSK